MNRQAKCRAQRHELAHANLANSAILDRRNRGAAHPKRFRQILLRSAARLARLA
jgi:hypothetical protein